MGSRAGCCWPQPETPYATTSTAGGAAETAAFVSTPPRATWTSLLCGEDEAVAQVLSTVKDADVQHDKSHVRSACLNLYHCCDTVPLSHCAKPHAGTWISCRRHSLTWLHCCLTKSHALPATGDQHRQSTSPWNGCSKPSPRRGSSFSPNPVPSRCKQISPAHPTYGHPKYAWIGP